MKVFDPEGEMRLGEYIDPEALRSFREARGLTHEQLADVVGGSPLEVAAWEGGSVRVPLKQARRLRRQDVAARREAAIAAAALPGCPWADAHAPRLHAMLLDHPHYLDPLSQETRSHLDGCPACTRVLDCGRGLVHLKPDPGLGTDLSGSLEHWFDTVPRSVLYLLVVGAGTALAVGSVDRVLSPEGPSAPAAESVWVGAVRTALWSGVAFGVTATVLRRLLRRRPYLVGMLSGGAGVLAGMLTWIMAAPGEHWFSGPALLVLLVLGVVLGALAGRWNEQNPWDDGAEAGQVEADPGRLAPPDPLRDLRGPDAAGISPERATHPG
jgi:DNA-binding XRE family transcriptional regulator